MNLIICATDGINNQYKNLKPGTTVNQAIKIINNLIDNDYLGIEFCLLNENFDEIEF